jgi:hypothetical protein
MQFKSPWSPAYRFTAQKDSISNLEKWGCRHKAGVYVIRDETDTQTLYVGKAENTGPDIKTRLSKHLTGWGNARIAAQVDDGKTFVVRWVESPNPGLTEQITMTALLPTDNQRMEWKRGDVVSYEEYKREAERLGLASEERALDRLAKWLVEDRARQQKQTPIWERNESRTNRQQRIEPEL